MSEKINHDEKILLITDSACDIPDEAILRGGIVMLPIPIAIDGKGYLERVDFTIEEFYERLAIAKEYPSTSHILASTYEQSYVEALDQGYTHVIVTSITSRGSNMFEAAVMGKKLFLAEHPEALSITVMDSGNYTLAYGYPIMLAADLVREGKTAAQIVEYLDDWYSCVEIIFAAYSLEYAKKSGRIPAAAAFVGDVLGLRPIISIVDGQTKVVEKVRGDKNVVTRLVAYAKERVTDKNQLTAVISGTVPVYGDQLLQEVTKELGRAPGCYEKLGASIAMNSGPKTIGIVYRGQKRIGTRASESDYK